MISKNLSLYADLRVFLIIITTFILIGCLFVYSASSVYALETFGTSLFFVKRQLCGLCVGIIALCVRLDMSIGHAGKLGNGGIVSRARIAEAGNSFQTDVLFFGILLFTATGLVTAALLDRIESWFERWRPA